MPVRSVSVVSDSGLQSRRPSMGADSTPTEFVPQNIAETKKFFPHANGECVRKSSSQRFSQSLLKPVAVIASVYASVVLTVVNLWADSQIRSGLNTLRNQSHHEDITPVLPAIPTNPETRDSMVVTQVTVASKETPVQSIHPSGIPDIPNKIADDGKPYEVKGQLLKVAWAWKNTSNSASILADQRISASAVGGFVPQRLEVAGVHVEWREIFEITFESGQVVRASECLLLQREPLSDDVASGSALIQVAGEAVTLACNGDILVHWSAALMRMTNGAEVLRVRVVFSGSTRRGMHLASTASQLSTWISQETAADCSQLARLNQTKSQKRPKPTILCLEPLGSVEGSPLVDTWLGVWLALEHPRSRHARQKELLSVGVTHPTPDTAYLSSLGATFPYSFVKAESDDDRFPSLRRYFNSYLDIIRAPSPNYPQLNYATWYDLRRAPCVDSTELGKPFCKAAQTLDDQTTRNRLRTIQKELSKRGVQLDCIMLDDGWDSVDDSWAVDPGNFPDGFLPLTVTAHSLSTSVGVWISPWGGFGESGKRRIQRGAAHGLETYDGSPNTFRLAGPHYYASFRNVTRRLVLNSSVRNIKFDGFGVGLGSEGGGNYAADSDRLTWLAEELRESAQTASSAELWLAFSTGSWPSPFWLLSGNSIWRGGPDLGKEGDGSQRQMWITFRDSMVYTWIVKRAPLFPLSGLGLGGVVWSSVEEPGAYLDSYEMEDFKTEVRSYFLTGSGFQELLIQPSLFTKDHWDVLADAANFSKHYAYVLRDAHWVGGDPAQGAVYGYASYACSPCLGILSWRNPRSVAQNLSFTLRQALSLPQNWVGGSVGGRWRVQPVWPKPAVTVNGPIASKTHSVDGSAANASAVNGSAVASPPTSFFHNASPNAPASASNASANGTFTEATESSNLRPIKNISGPSLDGPVGNSSLPGPSMVEKPALPALGVDAANQPLSSITSGTSLGSEFRSEASRNITMNSPNPSGSEKPQVPSLSLVVPAEGQAVDKVSDQLRLKPAPQMAVSTANSSGPELRHNMPFSPIAQLGEGVQKMSSNAGNSSGSGMPQNMFPSSLLRAPAAQPAAAASPTDFNAAQNASASKSVDSVVSQAGNAPKLVHKGTDRPAEALTQRETKPQLRKNPKSSETKVEPQVAKTMPPRRLVAAGLESVSLDETLSFELGSLELWSAIVTPISP